MFHLPLPTSRMKLLLLMACTSSTATYFPPEVSVSLMTLSLTISQGWRCIGVIGRKDMTILHDVDPQYSVAFRDITGFQSVICLPHNESLCILPKSGMMEIYSSLIACKILSRTSIERGQLQRIYGDGTSSGSPTC